MITSKDLNEHEGELSLLEIDINDEMSYFDGRDVSTNRLGFNPVNGLEMFKLARKARDYADKLINAADAMDLRIQIALDKPGRF